MKQGPSGLLMSLPLANFFTWGTQWDQSSKAGGDSVWFWDLYLLKCAMSWMLRTCLWTAKRPILDPPRKREMSLEVQWNPGQKCHALLSQAAKVVRDHEKDGVEEVALP